MSAVALEIIQNWTITSVSIMTIDGSKLLAKYGRDNDSLSPVTIINRLINDFDD
jgi:hypothetical protein